ncbi:MAG: thioredoxin fold domain-containing protein [Deltaproteobacteria bacterium]|nr:thioredoxin fold domain-containing protein [Deltaproteobacteria bacterium]
MIEVRGCNVAAGFSLRFQRNPETSSGQALKVAATCLVLTVIFLASPSYAGLRGLPEGKSRVQVGDSAPLETEDLSKAHEEGKVILLMFGNIDHCLYCEKVWSNIRELLPQYSKDVAAILKTHRASKFWGPEDEAVKLGERYGVIGEPWLFVIDKKGIVRHIFMGFTGKGEIEAEIKKALRG